MFLPGITTGPFSLKLVFGDDGFFSTPLPNEKLPTFDNLMAAPLASAIAT